MTRTKEIARAAASDRPPPVTIAREERHAQLINAVPKKGALPQKYQIAAGQGDLPLVLRERQSLMTGLRG
jgi:hypothetical protein